MTTIFVRGLSPAQTDEGLRALCAGYGRIVSAEVIRDRATGASRGFGFVDFATSDVAVLALKGLGKKRADWARPKASNPPPPPRKATIQLNVKVGGKRHVSATVPATGTAKDVLDELERVDAGIASDPRQRRLAFNDQQLDHSDRLTADVGIGAGGTLQLIWLPDRPSFQLLESHPSIFDDRYHYSFMDKPTDDDGEKRYRGGYRYWRPVGSMRYALKIQGKYDGGDDKWLGETGDGGRGEWPVAYHGTHERNIHPIVGQGLRLECGKRFRFGPGIYCTPDPRTALDYAEEYRDHRGRRCKMVLQLRVDPQEIRIIPCTDPDIHKLGHGDYWLLSHDDRLRICAVCVFPL